jgi:hypothetical protein
MSKEILKTVKGGIAPQPVFLNSGMIMGPAEHLSAMFEEMISYTNVQKDDQLAACRYCIEHLDKVDLDIENHIFRNKNVIREKLEDEGTPDGPAIIHFPGMRDENQQNQLLRFYEQY